MSAVAKIKRSSESNAFDRYATKAGAMLIAYWRLYPDRFAAFCEAEKPDYTLAPIQCMMLRAECRYSEVFKTGGRGITKSYTGLLSRMILGVLYPGIKEQYFGPSLKQTARIVSSTFQAIAKNYPLLASMWTVRMDGSERFKIETAYGSIIDVDVMRGTNANSVFA